jgi:hypothetical protein
VSTGGNLVVIVQGMCHPISEKGKCHPYENRGDLEPERTEAIIGYE